MSKQAPPGRHKYFLCSGYVRVCILIACFFAVSFFSGCGTTRKWRSGLEKEWLNKTKDELVTKRGKPFAINSADVKGTDIYIYHHTDFSPDILPNDYYEDFFVNSAGIIYKIETYAR